ncbi:hypothetical protein [Paenibacillus sp. URB8-2]|uniref:hypothetical protein n=1 Tax=Paenibacillus sp. URB8-2 TaxID=2741301 RepID=UPI0015BC0BEA|nr:hypothetical protein [Paenibacillus sp. URB8-2]BCG57680.1 hypothetical protein PUR_11050 [Paenibacillus sp. URB8-2]
MHDLIFIILGIFDAFAMLTIILKLYMLPVREYFVRILLFASFIALFSYLMRIAIGVPEWDLPLQYLLIILFLRLGLKIKVHLASFIAGAGICGYALIQVALYYFYAWTNLMNVGVLKENSGFYISLLQVSTIVAAFVLSWALTRFNLGFSFIIVPPHDFLVKENYFTNRNLILVIGSLASLATVSVTILFLYNANPLGLLLIAAVAFGLSFYFSGWSDRDDIRRALEAYRNKGKKV